MNWNTTMIKFMGVSLLLLVTACSGSGSNDRHDSSASSASSNSSVAPPEVAATCLASQFEQPSDLGLQRIIPDGQFQNLTGMSFLPGNDNVMYVTEQGGRIWRVELDGDSFTVDELVDLNDEGYLIFFGLGLNCNECGLFSVAFHPEFAENGYIYASFTSGDNAAQLHSYVIRMRSDDGGATLVRDASNRVIQETIYDYNQPTMTHNNGQVKFGPDGYLYVSFGDGGPGGDPDANAQDLTTPFGSILRMTDNGDPAPGNLLADEPGAEPRIFAYGLRNPWQWSFDRETGDLWAGDVGQAQVEEINVIVNGGNYGWPCFEGRMTYRDCGLEGPFIDPVWDQTHVDGRSITGGFVYRGGALPELYGTYLFSDFVSGIIWGLIADEEGNYERVQLLPSGQMVTAFAEDSAGELYILDYGDGGIYRLVAPEPNPDLQPLPDLLSMTGCVNPNAPENPAEHLIPYEINEPFWSDRAEKERYMVLPEGAVLALGGDDDETAIDKLGNFALPTGTTLVKNFRLNGRLIETRLLLNQENTGWTGFSYQWLEDGSDAVLLDGHLEMPIDGQMWHYPSRAECSQCHTPAAGISLGLEAMQLSKEIISPTTGMYQNQLEYFEELGLFGEQALDDELKELALPDSKDINESLDARARSFLHSNCANCHRPGGVTQSGLDFRFGMPGLYMNLCNVVPEQGDLGIDDARLMVPGDPERSLLWHRLVDEGEYRMPPLGSNLVDNESAELIREWISSLGGCDTPAGPEDAYFSIQNRWSSGFLIAPDGNVQTAVDSSTRWTLERVENERRAFYYRIRTVEEPYLYLWSTHNTSNPSLQVRPNVGEDWWSTHWELVPVDDTGYFRLRNRWVGAFVFVQGSTPQDAPALGPIQDGWHSAMWRFEELVEQ